MHVTFLQCTSGLRSTGSPVGEGGVGRECGGMECGSRACVPQPRLCPGHRRKAERVDSRAGTLRQQRGELLGGAQEPGFGQGALRSRLVGAGPCPHPGLWSSDMVHVVSGDWKSREVRATPGVALYVRWWHLSHCPWVRGVLLGPVVPRGSGPHPHGLCFHFSLGRSALSLSSLCQFSGM